MTWTLTLRWTAKQKIGAIELAKQNLSLSTGIFSGCCLNTVRSPASCDVRLFVCSLLTIYIKFLAGLWLRAPLMRMCMRLQRGNWFWMQQCWRMAWIWKMKMTCLRRQWERFYRPSYCGDPLGCSRFEKREERKIKASNLIPPIDYQGFEIELYFSTLRDSI